MMQGLFRNPLADPGLIGVSSGAALAAVATIVLGNGIAAPILQPLGVYALPVDGVFRRGGDDARPRQRRRPAGSLMIGTLLLAGIALGALSGALTGLIAYASDDRELRDLTLWSMGSLGGANWPKVVAVLPFAVLVTLYLAPRLVRGLNGFPARRGGGISSRHRRGEGQAPCIVLATAACVGAAVAVAGIIGFVGHHRAAHRAPAGGARPSRGAAG